MICVKVMHVADDKTHLFIMLLKALLFINWKDCIVFTGRSTSWYFRGNVIVLSCS